MRISWQTSLQRLQVDSHHTQWNLQPSTAKNCDLLLLWSLCGWFYDWWRCCGGQWFEGTEVTLPLFIKAARLQAGTANAANAAALRLELQQLDSELAEVQRVVPLRDELARIGTMHVMDATFSILTKIYVSKCITTSIQTYYIQLKWHLQHGFANFAIKSRCSDLLLSGQGHPFAAATTSSLCKWGPVSSFAIISGKVQKSRWAYLQYCSFQQKSKLLEDWLTKMVTKESNHQMLDLWASQSHRSPSRKCNARAERTRPQWAWTSWRKCVTAKLFSDLRTKIFLRLWNF